MSESIRWPRHNNDISLFYVDKKCLSFVAFILSTALANTISLDENFKGSDVLDEVPLIDGHNDLAHNLYKRERNQLEKFDFDSDLRQNPNWQISSSFTDLPRIRQGKLGGQFWVAYVGTFDMW